MPNAINLTTTTVFTLTYSDGDMAFTDQVTVFVYEVNLKIYTPPSLGGPVQVGNDLPSNFDEDMIGSQCFVNRDNDDNDGEIDLDDDNVPSENDLIQVTCALQWIIPAGIPVNYNDLPNKIKIEPKTGGDKIKIWNSPKKGFDYGGVAALKAAPNGNLPWNTPNIYIEGVMLSTSLRDVVLRGDLTASDGANCGDMVALSVIDVMELKWVGINGNGLPGLDLSGDSDALISPNDELYDPGLLHLEDHGVKSYRVFPDARLPDKDKLYNQVKLNLILNLPPIKPVTFFVKVFDVDDPSTCTIDAACEGYSMLDPNDCNGSSGFYYGTNDELFYTKDDDNRGFVQVGAIKSKSGFLAGQDNSGISTYAIPAGQIELSKNFTVSLQPGDNFRAVCNFNIDFVKKARNFDKEDDVDIVEILGAGINTIIKQPNSSDILTVWRQLHVESDKMASSLDPVNNNDLKNEIWSEFTDLIFSTSSLVTQLKSSTTGEDFDDGSLKIGDMPEDNGRFENGKLRLPSGSDFTFPIKGNSLFDLYFNAPTNIFNKPWKCILKSADGTLVKNAKITSVVKNSSGVPSYPYKYDWYITDIESGILLKNFLQGTVSINIGGTPMKIWFVGAGNAYATTHSMNIPYKLRDDDRVAKESVPQPDGLIVYHMAYLHAQVNEEDYNTSSPPFYKNLNSAPAGTTSTYDPKTIAQIYRQSIDLESNNCWFVYVSGAWQESESRDDDPEDSEDLLYGRAYTSDLSNHEIAQGSDFAFIYEESFADGSISNMSEQEHKEYSMAHEIGHQFGLAHTDNDPSLPSGVSDPICEKEFAIELSLMKVAADPDGQLRIIQRQLHLIRSRVKSPGQ